LQERTNRKQHLPAAFYFDKMASREHDFATEFPRRLLAPIPSQNNTSPEEIKAQEKIILFRVVETSL